MSTQVISTVSAGFLPQYEFIDSKMLAERWALPESWIREGVRSRTADPIPHLKFGKYIRFRWGSPELAGWAERRIVGSLKTNRAQKMEVIH
jgi:hypothetical protein